MEPTQEKAVAVKIRHVSKEYRLGEIGRTTLQHELQSWWSAKRGRPDPNLPIGMEGRKGDRFSALSDVSMTIYEGDTLGIIGRNGAGKSTLLKLLCRITAPTEGTIDTYGRITSMLEIGTGFHKEMTGRENIYMNGAILGMSRAEIDAKMDQIIAFSEIGPFIDTPVKRYSSGMYVKLGFAVASHLDSEIKIMDEVLAVSDAAFQKKCLAKMREEAAGKKRTILYVSHNMQTIRELCDRCAVLENGKLIFLGDTETAIGMYLRQEGDKSRIDFRQTPQMSWLKHAAVCLLEASFEGSGSRCFGKDEPVRFRLMWKGLRDVERAGLRVELRSADNIPQGFYVRPSFCRVQKDETAAAVIELDTHGLAPAVYQMVYTFFSVDEFGRNTDLECRFGLYFEVTGNDYPGIWDTRNWGYHLMEGMKVYPEEGTAYA